jgi:hypothetical protein
MSEQCPQTVVIERTRTKELVLVAAEDYVELAEKHIRKGEAYGITLRGRVLEIWKEEGGVRRVAASEELPEDEARRVKEDMLNVKDFRSFATLVFFLLYIRKKLARGVHAGSRI